MCVLSVSSQMVVACLDYLLESDTISVKSLQTYLSVINTVHNDFETRCHTRHLSVTPGQTGSERLR